MADSGADCLGVDWTTDLSLARKLTQDKVALQGNLDPCVLFADNDVIESEVKKVLDSYGKGSGHIFNLGHGMQPNMQPEKLAVTPTIPYLKSKEMIGLFNNCKYIFIRIPDYFL